MKVAVFSTKSYDREYFGKFNTDGIHQLTYFDAPLNEDTTNLTIGFDAVCVFVNDKVDKAVIQKIAHNGIRVIALRCAGFNNIDLGSAAENQIKVVRVPAYSPEAVAEYAVALILTLNRKTHKAYNRIREGNFSLEKLVGFDLNKKTIGVIGTGKIGVIFSRLMLGFGCKVLAFDKYESDELKSKGVEYFSFDQILERSDIISLHCPLTNDTYHLFNSESFVKIKPGMMIINTSRGAVIDTSAAIEALKTGRLGYLGIDVYEQEEKLFFKDLSESIIQDDVFMRLMSFPNVLITSHQGFFTKEALDEIALTTLKNLTDFVQGRFLENEVKM